MARIAASGSASSATPLRRRLGDDAAGNVMRLAEGHAGLAGEPVGHVRGGGKTRARRGAHGVATWRHVAHHAGHGGERQRQAGKRVEDLLLVLLHVLGIGERQALHDDQQRGEGAGDAAGLGAHQLGGVRVALLRHDRGAGGEAVGEPDEAELRRAPQHDLLGEARQVHGANRGGGKRLQREIAVRHGVERVGGRPVEAERHGGGAAVDRPGRAGERRGAQRALVQPPAAIDEAAAVAIKHLHIGEEVMPEGNRLGALQMREARHHGVGMFGGLRRQRHLQGMQLAVDVVDGVAHPEAEIRRHLVVAGAGGVQPSGGLADQLGEARFHVHVDVFQRARKFEAALRDFRRDKVQARDDLRGVLARNDALIGQHAGMRPGAGDVLGRQRLVKIDGGVDLLHDRVRRLAEPAAPHPVRHNPSRGAA